MPTTIQQRPLANRPSDWSDTVTFNQIDPASSPTSITLALDGTLTSVASVLSFERATSTFTSTNRATVTLALPNGGSNILAAQPSTTVSTALAAYTGQQPALVTLPSIGTDHVSTAYIAGGTPNPVSAALTGAGTATLPVAATAHITASGPGNLAAVFASDIAATASLSATTGPGPNAPIGSGSTGGSFFGITYPPIAFLIGSTTTQTVTLARATTGWTAPVTVNGFNPLLGQLAGVEFNLAVNSTASFGIENEDAASTAISLHQNAAVTLSNAAGATLDSATATLFTTRNLAAFDGAADNAGPSGATVTGLATTAADTGAAFDAATLARFTGAAPITLTASATGQTVIDGPGNLAVGASLQAGATITVTYHYTAANNPLFDRAYYLAQNPGVAQAGIDPLLHYVVSGQAEHRSIFPA